MSERSFGRRPFDFLNCSTFATTFSLDLRLDELQQTTTTPSNSVRTKSSGHFMVQKRYANINSRSSSIVNERYGEIARISVVEDPFGAVSCFSNFVFSIPGHCPQAIYRRPESTPS